MGVISTKRTPDATMLAGWRYIALLIALLVIFLVSRWPFLSARVESWDTVQHALGIAEFDLAMHAPHPPGAPTYHALVRLAHFVCQDAAASVLGVGLLLGAILVATSSLLGGAWEPRRDHAHRWVVPLLLTSAPLLWLHSVSGGSAAGDAALAAMLGYFVIRLRTHRLLRDAVIASFILAFLLGFRQNVNLASASMIPLWVWGIGAVSWRGRALAGVCLAIGCLGWSIPTAAASGGWRELMDVTLLHTRNAHGGGVMAGGILNGRWAVVFTAMRHNAGQSLGLVWLPLCGGVVMYLVRLVRNRHLRSDKIVMTAVWLIPVLIGATLLPYHMEEYFSVILPLLCLWAADGVVVAAGLIARIVRLMGAGIQLPPGLLVRGATISSVATILVANGAYYIVAHPPDPFAQQSYETIVRIRRAFDPSSTLVLSDGLGQRFGAVSLPEYSFVYLPLLRVNSSHDYTVRTSSHGRETVRSDSAGALATVGRGTKSVIIASSIPVECAAPLTIEDFGGDAGVVRVEDGELVVRYDRNGVYVSWVESPIAQRDVPTDGESDRATEEVMGRHE